MHVVLRIIITKIYPTKYNAKGNFSPLGIVWFFVTMIEEKKTTQSTCLRPFFLLHPL